MNSENIQRVEDLYRDIAGRIGTQMRIGPIDIVPDSVERDIASCYRCGVTYPSLCISGRLVKKKGPFECVEIWLVTYDSFNCNCEYNNGATSLCFKAYFGPSYREISYGRWIYISM
jgi:hypothetical protein